MCGSQWGLFCLPGSMLPCLNRNIRVSVVSDRTFSKCRIVGDCERVDFQFVLL